MLKPTPRLIPIVLLLLGVALGPAVHGASATSPARIKTAESCSADDYAKNPDPAPLANPDQDLEQRKKTTLMVVAGDEKHRLNTTTYVRMGEQVTVCIRGLHDWIWVQGNKPSTLRLSIGGHILSTVAPSTIGPSDQEYLNFVPHLDPSQDADWKAWAAIVDASRHEGSKGDDKELGKLTLTVATNQNESFETVVYARIGTGGDSWYWILILFVLLIGTLAYLAVTRDMLSSPLSTRPKNAHSPFSLAMVQMAFWFCLSVGAYVYISLVTRQVHVPMGSVLGLLGISATTGLAAVFVDKRKSDDATDGQKATPPATSHGFVTDILSDGDGVSFHRFQIAVWTIVLGTAFVWSVYHNITMPEFDASLLTLMGVSSGTYVGFKFGEKPKTGEAPAEGGAA
jgi:hypothetical protein